MSICVTIPDHLVGYNCIHTCSQTLDRDYILGSTLKAVLPFYVKYFLSTRDSTIYYTYQIEITRGPGRLNIQSGIIHHWYGFSWWARSWTRTSKCRHCMLRHVCHWSFFEMLCSNLSRQSLRNRWLLCGLRAGKFFPTPIFPTIKSLRAIYSSSNYVVFLYLHVNLGFLHCLCIRFVRICTLWHRQTYHQFIDTRYRTGNSS